MTRAENAPLTRIALVTGGARGLGRSIAQKLAAQGHTVILGDILTELAEQTASELAVALIETPLTLESQTAEYFAAGVAETVLGRLPTPDEVADAVAFLCSDQASALTGIVIDVAAGAFMP